MDKCYLWDLEVSVVVVLLIFWLDDYVYDLFVGVFVDFDCDEIVIKLCISVNVDDIYCLICDILMV